MSTRREKPPGAQSARAVRLWCGVAIASAAVAALSVAFGRAWDPLASYDFYAYYAPNAEYLGERLAHGEWPLWNPDHGLGSPFLAAAQPGVLYPPNWLHALLPSRTAFGLLVALHLALATAATAGLAAALGAGTGGCIAAGLLFALARWTFDASWAPPLVYAIAWMPAVLLAVDRVCHRGGTRWTLALAVFWSLQVLAGWPYVVALTTLAAAIYGAGLIAFDPEARSWRTWVWIAMAAVIGVGLAAPQLLPSAELTALSPRAIHQLSKDQAVLGVGSDDLAIFFHRAFWSDGNQATPSAAAALLACVGLAPARAAWRRRSLLLFGVGAFGLAVSFPHSLPVYDWVQRLPVIGDFRFPVHFRLLTRLAISVLAGVGVTRLSAWLPTGRWRIAGVATALVLAIGPLGARLLRPDRPSGEMPDGLRAAREQLDAFGRLARRQPSRVYWADRSTRSIGPVALLNDLEPLGLASTAEALTFFQTGRASQRYAAPARPRPLELGRSRVFAESPYAGLIHVPDDGRRAALLDLLSVELVSAHYTAAWLDDRYGRPIARVAGDAVYRNAAALQRAYFASRAELEPALRQDALERLVADDFDPGYSVLLDRLPRALGEPAEAPSDEPPVAVEIVEYRPESVALRVRARRSGVVVLADAWYPGWQARLDGRPAELLRANVVLRGVAVPPGEHRIDMRYAPASFRLGLLWAAVSATAAVGLAWRAARSPAGA